MLLDTSNQTISKVSFEDDFNYLNDCDDIKVEASEILCLSKSINVGLNDELTIDLRRNGDTVFVLTFDGLSTGNTSYKVLQWYGSYIGIRDLSEEVWIYRMDSTKNEIEKTPIMKWQFGSSFMWMGNEIDIGV